MRHEIIKEKYIEDLNNNILKTTVEIIDGVAGKNGKRGAGVIVDKNGYIFTNLHSVGDLEFTKPIVTLITGEEIVGKVEHRDIKNNFAIVKVNRHFESENVIAFGDSDEIKVGNTVICVGQVRGIKFNNISNGVISNTKLKPLKIKVSYNTQQDGYTDVIEKVIKIKKSVGITTDIECESSGGPIFNKKGELIGMGCAYLTYQDSKTSSIMAPIFSVAVPVNTLVNIFRDYLLAKMAAYNEPLPY